MANASRVSTVLVAALLFAGGARAAVPEADQLIPGKVAIVKPGKAKVKSLGSGYLHYGQMSGTVAVFDIGSGGNGLTAAGNSDNGSADAMGAMLREIDTSVSVWPNVDLF